MTYTDEVQTAIDFVVELAERAERANQHELSAYYGSVCKWIRSRESIDLGFTLVLPTPETGGDPLIVLEIFDRIEPPAPAVAGDES